MRMAFITVANPKPLPYTDVAEGWQRKYVQT